jgi:hypothetical protein
VLLNHARSRQSGLNDLIVSGVIDNRLRDAYVTILSAVTAICRERSGRAIPIIVHGYDYPVPDGRGFMGGFGPLPGPWLEPGLREKGFDPRGDLDGCTVLVAALMDRFNAMLAEIASIPAFAHVKYLDLRGTLSNGPGYKTWWANELHPTLRGFTAVADRFAAAIP